MADQAINLDKQPGGRGHCVACDVLTIWACPFCRVYEGTIRWLCENAECREQHEKEGCVRTKRKVVSHG